jgi:hypothetical protein
MLVQGVHQAAQFPQPPPWAPVADHLHSQVHHETTPGVGFRQASDEGGSSCWTRGGACSQAATTSRSSLLVALKTDVTSGTCTCPVSLMALVCGFYISAVSVDIDHSRGLPGTLYMSALIILGINDIAWIK